MPPCLTVLASVIPAGGRCRDGWKTSRALPFPGYDQRAKDEADRRLRGDRGCETGSSMSTPQIPGYTASTPRRTLADEWLPDGDYPEVLWPEAVVRQISPEPFEWLTIVEHFFNDDRHGGTSCVLVDGADIESALGDVTWLGSDLGDVGIWGDGTFEDGLSGTDTGLAIEFFCQARDHHGLRPPTVEISHPFLWYWDAFETAGNWLYLNRAGRDQPLIRSAISEDEYRVQVRALEFRQYLAARGLAAVVQFDHVENADAPEFERKDSEHRSEWVNASWHCLPETLGLGRSAFSRLLGRYLILPLEGPRKPRWEERRQDRQYPEFQYGVDPNTGSPLLHTCNPDELGTYFDKDGSRLHYLTPIYFRREVLGRYVDEPSRYEVTATRLRCLDLWGVDISTNTAGLIEVYLGDLGRDLPSDEWPHWLGHNVAPEGEMAEDRFRRDILNQPSPSKDLPRRVRAARSSVASAAQSAFGVPIWRDLTGPESTAFQRLHGPTSPEPTALNGPVLTMTKALIDSIDPKSLRHILDEPSSEVPSLQLLESVELGTGGDGRSTAVLRDLQRLRSAGGIAHLSGKNREKVLDQIGIVGMKPNEAFDHICTLVSEALEALAERFDDYQVVDNL